VEIDDPPIAGDETELILELCRRSAHEILVEWKTGGHVEYPVIAKHGEIVATPGEAYAPRRAGGYRGEDSSKGVSFRHGVSYTVS
jgi:hypothetical protein